MSCCYFRLCKNGIVLDYTTEFKKTQEANAITTEEKLELATVCLVNSSP